MILDMRPERETSRLYLSISRCLVFVFYLPLQYALEKDILLWERSRKVPYPVPEMSILYRAIYLLPLRAATRGSFQNVRARNAKLAEIRATLYQQARWYGDLIHVEG